MVDNLLADQINIPYVDRLKDGKMPINYGVCQLLDKWSGFNEPGSQYVPLFHLIRPQACI
jgi:hypothetical protein